MKKDSINKYKLLIFDFDGTLADTRKNIVMTMQQTMEELKLSVADERTCAATIGLPLEACFVQIFPELSTENIKKCAETYRRIFEINRKKLVPLLYPNVETTLHKLHNEGFVLSVASSRFSTSLRAFLDEMNIANLFSCVLGADDVKNAKPAPEPVLKTLDLLHFTPSETLVIGDMPVDIEMGNSAGADTCGVTYGNADKEQISASNPTYIIENMIELLQIVK